MAAIRLRSQSFKWSEVQTLNGIDFLSQNYTFIPNLITIYFELIMTILILIEPFAKNRAQNYLEAEIEQIVKSLGVLSSF